MKKEKFRDVKEGDLVRLKFTHKENSLVGKDAVIDVELVGIVENLYKGGIRFNACQYFYMPHSKEALRKIQAGFHPFVQRTIKYDRIKKVKILGNSRKD